MRPVLVSIVVPVYNVERYLEECLEKLINQTYKNIEILLIDDGSTDKSGNICDEWSRKDSRIVVFHKKNEGLGLTRNYGVERATGEYVIFPDSDDYITTNAIEKIMTEREKVNADSVIFGFNKVKNGKIIYTEKYERALFEEEDVKNKLLPRFVGSSPSCRDGIFQTACMKLYSIEIIKNNNLKFVSEREYQSEDLVFQLDYYFFSKKVIVIDDVLYSYRFSDNSLTTKYKPERFWNEVKVYKYIREKFKEYGLDSESFLRLGKLFFVQIYCALSFEVPSRSGKTAKKCLESIKIITHDNIVDEVIKDYPVKKLNLKQQIFVLLIKRKYIHLIYLYMFLKAKL